MSGDETSDPSHWQDVTAGAADPASGDGIRAGEASKASLEMAPGRDGYAAGRDVNITQHVYPPTAPPAGPARTWGAVPARNRKFIGRAALLREVHDSLHAGRQDPESAGGRVAVQAIQGMGGIGKTQLAIEYAHSHADDYDIVWWINAENPGLINEQLAALAVRLGCAAPDAPVSVAAASALSDLHDRDRLLLIFDNAVSPADLAGYLPGGAGHVLITSRTADWDEIAVLVEVDVLPRAESITLLRERVKGMSAADAGTVADALGDLPLALAQAGSYLAETGMPAAEYATLLRTRAAELLAEGKSAAYPDSLAAVVLLGFDKLKRENPAAADLAAVCAFLAPEPIPVDWFRQGAKHLPRPLREQVADPAARHRLVAALTRSALARQDDDSLILHRLTQDIIRTHLRPREAAAAKAQSVRLVIANAPSDVNPLDTWPTWVRFLPHLQALAPGRSADFRVGSAVISLGVFWGGSRLLGDVKGPISARTVAKGLAQGAALVVASRTAAGLYEEWRIRQSEYDRQTLRAAQGLARALRDLGHYAEARELDQVRFDRLSLRHGDRHYATLSAAGDLALDLFGLGQYLEALELSKETLARRRRSSGDGHPDTLACASHLADCHYALGDYEAARDLHAETLIHRLSYLGDDDADVLASASSLARDLRALGDYQMAREMDEDTLERRQRLLGADHPDTAETARNLAADLRALGEGPPELES
jgi:tetratricopeptide (TPR) repeat protein